MKLGLDLCGLSVCLGGGYNFMPAGSTVVVMDTWKRKPYKMVYQEFSMPLFEDDRSRSMHW